MSYRGRQTTVVAGKAAERLIASLKSADAEAAQHLPGACDRQLQAWQRASRRPEGLTPSDAALREGEMGRLGQGDIMNVMGVRGENGEKRALVLPRPRSGTDVGREVLTGEGGAVGDEVGRRALEDDPAAVVAGAGAEVHDPVGVRHDRLVVFDDDHRLARVDEPVEQAEEPFDVGEVQAAGRLVEDVDVALPGHLGGQLQALAFPA